VCDFVVWTLCSMIVLTVACEEQYEARYLSTLKHFYEEHFIMQYVDQSRSASA